MSLNKFIFLLFICLFCLFLGISNVFAYSDNNTDVLMIDTDDDYVLNMGIDSIYGVENNQIDTYLNSSDVIKYYGGSERYGVYLSGYGNIPLANKQVDILINGITYYRNTDNNGYASIAINLNPGNYSISCSFNGDEYYKPSTAQNWIFVNSTIYGEDLVKYYQNSSQYFSLFFSVNGVALANTAVTFNINGVIYTRTTNATGWASLNINLNPGKYIITATNPVNGEMHSNNITVLSILIANDLYMGYKDGSRFEVIVLDDLGNPYPNQNVTFNINGMFYVRLSNDYGVASLNINLSPGEYIISSIYKNAVVSNTIYISSNSVSHKSYVLYSVNANMQYNEKGSYFYAILKYNDGSSAVNKSVLLSVGNYHRASLTDANGLVKWLIDWDVGVYNTIISFKYFNNKSDRSH
ncbi:Ig-like domain-containing protein, partial [Methanobrevibacter sp.]|uniref:Ig-like domain-containing protein n=1 Tax=Methanobrevibacter sp. TaxID=66852 RepID=UPI00388D49D7